MQSAASARALAEKYGGDPSRSYALCLRAFAMGDHSACDVVEAVPEGVLERGGLSLINPSPMVVLCPRVFLFSIGPAARGRGLIAKARAAYQDACLDANLSKRFERQVDFKAWGAQVRGGRGSLSSPTESRVAVANLLDLILEVGFVTKKIIETVCGLLAYAFGYRRELLSLLQESF